MQQQMKAPSFHFRSVLEKITMDNCLSVYKGHFVNYGPIDSEKKKTSCQSYKG